MITTTITARRARRAATLIVLAAMLVATTVPVFATGTVEIEPQRTVTDALGRSVEIPEDPQRIVAAGRAVLMIADALYMFPGAEDRIIGIGRINQGKGNFLAAIDPDYGEKAVLERNVGAEQIAGLNPDVVVLKTFMRGPLGDAVEQIGIPVVYVDLETPEQYQRDLRLLGDVLNQSGRGSELARYYEVEAQRVRRTVDAGLAASSEADAGADDSNAPDAADDITRPSTLFLYADLAGGEQVFNVPPVGWIQTTMVEIAGGDPVWVDSNPGGGWTSVGLEQIAAWNADVITLVAYRQDVSAIRDTLYDTPVWSDLTAIETGNLRIFPVDFYSWDQPDVRWILGLQWLAKTLHPELFPELDVAEEMYDFFSFAYRMSREQVDTVIVPVLEGISR